MANQPQVLACYNAEMAASSSYLLLMYEIFQMSIEACQNCLQAVPQLAEMHSKRSSDVRRHLFVNYQIEEYIESSVGYECGG
jgi:hypothetical protein